MDFTARLMIDRGSGEENLYLHLCLSFVYERELYMPYSSLRARFYLMEDEIKAEQVKTVYFYCDDVLKHKGLPDSINVKPINGGCIIDIVSRGHTLLLMQNEPYPRINTNVDLKKLITDNIDDDDIRYEDPTPTQRYIYVNERSTVWDAIVAYSIKATGYYPYIRNINIVRVTIGTPASFNYQSELMTESGTELLTENLLSDVYMQDVDDQYNFSAHSAVAQAAGIVRSRYYPLDNQWLYDPAVGLGHKLNYSCRGMKVKFFTYAGYKGEELMDRAYNCGDADGMRINAVRVVGSRKGIFTTVKCYDDMYGQKT